MQKENLSCWGSIPMAKKLLEKPLENLPENQLEILSLEKVQK